MKKIYRIKFRLNGKEVVKKVYGPDMIRLTAAVDRKNGKIETILIK